jgi:uncharacterized membrane protein
LAALGFLDSLYLAVKHYTGGPIPCAITTGCETVTNSIYNSFLGVPLGVWGIVYYGLALFLWWQLAEKRQAVSLRLLVTITAAGLLFSSRLFYIQAAVLKAYCLYCLTSAGITLALFLLSFFLLRQWPDDNL